MNDFFRVLPAVFIAVVKDDQILLVKRKNTGFMDGFYDLPSGHIEKNETILEAAARELKEETGLMVDSNKLKLIHVGQSEYNKDSAYIYFMFKALEWRGDPKNMEPGESDEVAFYPLTALPETVPHILYAIENLNLNQVTFGYMTQTEEEFLKNKIN